MAIAAALRAWGIRAAISVDFGSPKTVGGLDTFDPADPRVAAWWAAAADNLYQAVPDLAGFVLKADSEGRVGPSAYGRTHADAAILDPQMNDARRAFRIPLVGGLFRAHLNKSAFGRVLISIADQVGKHLTHADAV